MVEYCEIIETTIRKQIETIGKPVALRQARKVEGLEIADDGTVTCVEGDGKELLEQVVDNFRSMLGPVATATTVRAIKKEYGEDIDIELPDIIRKEF